MQSKLGKPPLLRSVERLTKSKDVDFLSFFDSRKTQVFQNLRHRYQDVYYNVLDGFSHLRLFTKHLKKMIDASQTSANEYLNIVKEYRSEEPTLITGHTSNDTVTSVKLPESFVNESKEDDNIGKKTDIDAFAEVFEFERRMSILLVTFWNRMDKEVYTPLYQYRKASLLKIEKLHGVICKEYDKLIKSNTVLRDLKIKAILIWNELCDARHTLRKVRQTNDAKLEKKTLKTVTQLENKVTKIFTNVVDTTDSFNKQQNEFWNETLKETLLQFEAMEYTRIQFYTEYYEKYKDLLSWRKSELANGEKTLERAKKDILSPVEILEVNTYVSIQNNGKYNAVQPLQYELPCMPKDVSKIKDKLSETRIDPQILKPVYNPFLNALEKVGTTRKSVAARSTRGSITHGPNPSVSVSNTFSQDVISYENMFQHDLQAQKVFARTQKNYGQSPKMGGFGTLQLVQTLSAPIIDEFESDCDVESDEIQRSKSQHVNKPKKPKRKQTRPNKPPPSLHDFKKQIEIQKSQTIKPNLPPRNSPRSPQPTKPPRKPPRNRNRATSETLNTIRNKKKGGSTSPRPAPPRKNVNKVAENVRRQTLDGNSDNFVPKKPGRPPNKPPGRPPKLPPKPPRNVGMVKKTMGNNGKKKKKVKNEKWY